MPDQRFLKYQDVNMRLDGTIVRYKGEFYHVQASGDESTNVILRGLPLGPDGDFRGARIRVDANEEGFDFRSPALGYANSVVTTFCQYFTRIPYRKQKQGISSSNVLILGLDGKTREVSQQSLWEESFYNMLRGIYPSAVEAYDKVLSAELQKVKPLPSFAFSRELVIGCKGVLLYRVNEVGTVEKTPQGLLATLDDAYNNSILTMKLANHGVSVR